MSVVIIRRWRPADEPRLYQICLRTGDSRADATGQYADPDLLGHVYVGPYLRFAPDNRTRSPSRSGASGTGGRRCGSACGVASPS